MTDHIYLPDIDANFATRNDQAFAFIGAGAFTGVAGQLRYVSGTGVLEGNTNGDGVADFQLNLTSKPVITVDDLLL